MADPVARLGAVLAGLYLILLVTEVVPPFVPTLFLLAAVPLALGPLGAQFALRSVLTWPADPVVALFAGAFCLGVAARRHGLDQSVAVAILRVSHGRKRALVFLVLLVTAGLSMWMSNIAAAAMMLAVVGPILGELPDLPRFRKALLLAVAFGANLGGMATPVGTGPNGVAIAALADRATITFL